MASGEGVSVTVYGQPGCGDCRAVEEVFKKRKVAFTYVEGDQAIENATRICTALGRLPAFPVITVAIRTREINTQFAAIEPRGLALTLFGGMLQVLQGINRPR